MLVLTRKTNQSIRIAEGITVKIVRVGRGQVQLGIDAPKEIPIIRSEIQTRVVGEAA